MSLARAAVADTRPAPEQQMAQQHRRHASAHRHRSNSSIPFTNARAAPGPRWSANRAGLDVSGALRCRPTYYHCTFYDSHASRATSHPRSSAGGRAPSTVWPHREDERSRAHLFQVRLHLRHLVGRVGAVELRQRCVGRQLRRVRRRRLVRHLSSRTVQTNRHRRTVPR